MQGLQVRHASLIQGALLPLCIPWLSATIYIFPQFRLATGNWRGSCKTTERSKDKEMNEEGRHVETCSWILLKALLGSHNCI